MDRFEQIYTVHRVLRRARYPVSTARLQEELDHCSTATLRRVIADMRNYLGAPIESSCQGGGYWYAEEERASYELPGLWFSAREIHALLTFHHFLENLQPGLLSVHLQPLKRRLEALLESGDPSWQEIKRRIRILPQAARFPDPAVFQRIAHAVLGRKRLRFRYHGRARNELTDRTVSPQRLVHYRDNWYLDGWDHGKRALRTFAVERIHEPHLLEERAQDLSEERLDRYFGESYGIFAGRPRHRAVLRFSPRHAPWVAEETWHPQQRGWFEGECYFLEIPYSDDRELVLDILKHGPEVEVLRPKSLRRKILDALARAVSQYQLSAPR